MPLHLATFPVGTLMPRCSLDVSLDVLVAFAAEGAEASLRLPGAARSVTYWRLGQIQGAEGMEKPWKNMDMQHVG